MDFSVNCEDVFLNHPSQLYEAVGEGLIIFIILWLLRNHPVFKKHLFAIFLILYGLIRFVIEFFRQPEITFAWLTMGQILCFAMIILGIVLIIFINQYSSDEKK
jgi:phosphatidylglycerol:prolipoprotein diacylglycerol transferase